MDLLASRVAGNAKNKTKSKKYLKRLSKNDSSKSNKKIAKKSNQELPAEKQTVKKSLANASPKKIKIIKDTIIGSQKNKFEKSLEGVTPNVLKKKKKGLVEDLTKSIKQVVPEVKKKVKKPDVKSIVAGIIKSSKKVKAEPAKLVKAENNKEIKNIKSKKRKQLDAKKENRSENTEVPSLIKKEITVENRNKTKSLSKKEVKPKVEDNKEIKSIKSKKRKHSVIENEPKTEGSLTKKAIIDYVKGVLKLSEGGQQGKRSLFNSEKPPVLLAVTCIKIPKVPLHQLRISLPHSLVSPTDDIALFVKDLKRGRRRDYEDTVRHYEDLLQEHGCNQIKTIIPMNQIKTEYRQFEMRRRLLNSHDFFIADGRIAGHMCHLLGKSFREHRKLPTSIHMDKKDLKSEIENALTKTVLQIHGKGDCSVTQVGSCAMSAEHIAENILAAINILKKEYPGGWNNIRRLSIKTPLSLAIPIYITLKNKNDVEVPVVAPKRPKAYKAVEGELSTFTSNVNVTVAPDGTVLVQNTGNEDSDDNSDNEDENITVKSET